MVITEKFLHDSERDGFVEAHIKFAFQLPFFNQSLLSVFIRIHILIVIFRIPMCLSIRWIAITFA
ncbi:hypothetical protein WJ73_28925 [Burkholderia ubonensis]|nr:hypothetical protein WJ73_28925 [Burkholderia ubonensis]